MRQRIKQVVAAVIGTLCVTSALSGGPIPPHVPWKVQLTSEIEFQVGQLGWYLNNNGVVVGFGAGTYSLLRYWRTDDPAIYLNLAPEDVMVPGVGATLVDMSGYLSPPCAEHQAQPLDIDDQDRILLRAPILGWSSDPTFCPNYPTWVPQSDSYIDLIFDIRTRTWSLEDGTWQFNQRTSNDRGQYLSNETINGAEVGLLYSPRAIPEPGTFWLLAAGTVVAAAVRTRSRMPDR